MYRIGVDVGGTFTDLVLVDDAGQVLTAKVPSCPGDPSVGVLRGLEQLAAAIGLERSALLRHTERLVHGTTVVTNALVEQKGARVGLITTEGHRDILEMREGLKDDRYNLRVAPPEPLVPRFLRVGVRERIRADGRIETPLDVKSLQRAVTRFKKQAVEAVAVCYLHAYGNGRHEKLTGTALDKGLPNVYVSLSSEVLPQIKEFERVYTTVVNAYVGPVLGRYLADLQARLSSAGYRGPVLIMESHGGVTSIPEAVRLAAGSVLSGPAGGVAGCRSCARRIQEQNLITFDMGGTSTDVSMIVNGDAPLAVNRSVAGHRISLPSLDIVTLGAGGGSKAWVDSGGILQVGPESVGAEPGPACYARGGTDASVTDANLVMGYLNPENFLGGKIRLNTEAAERAVDRVAGKLGIGRLAAARGIYEVVNTRMAEAIRLVSVRRGLDPRRFTLLAFGGAAGAHVTDVARRLEIRRVVVPRLAPVLSALGMLSTDLRCEIVRTHVEEANKITRTTLRRLFAGMEKEGRQRLGKAFRGELNIRRALDMRFGQQIFEITVGLDGLDLESSGAMAEVLERFHRRHEDLYTYSMRGEDVLVVNARLTVIGELPCLPEEPPLAREGVGSSRGKRRIYTGAWHSVPVFDADGLVPKQRIEGPAIVESSTTTILLARRDRAVVTPLGLLDIEVS